MSVVVVVIGVGICTLTDVKVNDKGFICACAAVLSTSLQQIFFILLSCFGRVLQCQPVPLHWMIFCDIIPGVRSHENSMHSHFGVAAF
ncbi:hypothetical protein SLE2022_123170 [Rubroshorea leprosula]